jgi:hypothetical protein
MRIKWVTRKDVARLEEVLMKTSGFLNDYRLTRTAGFFLVSSVLFFPGLALAQSYEGPEYCLTCHQEFHETNYNDWRVSGHPFMLMKSEDARNRPIPLPGGFTWDEISYVVGGYGRKSLYLDNNGYFITTTFNEAGVSRPGLNQYNNLTGEWSDYHPGEENLPYDCGSCHTTNYVATGNQGGLSGIQGTWDSEGIECEQCHGNGLTMNKDDSSALCGTCHTRGDSSAVIPASDGFILNNGQYNEYLAGAHSTWKCSSCHNPHKHYGVRCEDCHMPFATLAAEAIGPYEGDRKTHIFYINTDPAANMFNEAGDFVALDNDGKAAVTLDFACKRCHATADLEELSRHAKNFHGLDTTVSPLEYIGLNPGLTGNWWGGAGRNGEGFLIEVAQSSGALVLIGSFYTYDTAGNRLWLIAVGPANTGMTSDVTLYISQGPSWGDAYDPNVLEQEVFGTGRFTFPSCDAGQVEITPNAKYMGLGFTSMGYALRRDITVSRIACPTFINNPTPKMSSAR